jgi:hypothetical protein
MKNEYTYERNMVLVKIETEKNMVVDSMNNNEMAC